jgi:hypothetical protein
MKRHKFLNRGALFDRIVLIACRLIKSPLALIVCPDSRKTIALGGFGFDDDEVPVPLKVDDFRGLPDRLNYLTKVQHQSWFQKSPLARVLPQARSVLVIPPSPAFSRSR